jgi:magnesium transporter
MDEYGLHPAVAQELVLPTFKPKVDAYPGHLYVIMHFPAFRHSHAKEASQEIDFIIGKDWIITARYGAVDPLHRLAKMFDVDTILDKHGKSEHAGALFVRMVSDMYESLLTELDFIRDSLRDIESKVFAGREREMVIALSNVSRDLLSFRHATSVHSDILRSLRDASSHFFGKGFEPHIEALEHRYRKVEHSTASHLESMSELRETNNALLETRQNSIMQSLTVITFITAPLSIFVAFFQIDARSRPLIGSENDFWILLATVGIIGISMYSFFRYKKWL